MGKKEIVTEALDWDRGLLPTFLTLFSDPAKVVMNPDTYARPWKYATYVVSISCLFTWFVIHSFVESQDQALFWLVPRRMLELLSGYQNFYENTQPLKRLVLGAAAFYVALTIFLFTEKKRMPGFLTMSLYLIGHSVFIVFIVQSVGMLFVRQWNSNVISLLGTVTHIVYLTYATIRILGKLKWTTILWKGLGIFVVQFTLYNASATRLIYHTYYGLLHRSEMIVRDVPSSPVEAKETVIDRPVEEKSTAAFIKEQHLDSLKIVLECTHPSGKEVAKIILRGYTHAELKWTAVIFEKINRYSPDPAEVLIKIDSTSRHVFAAYRIANDSNATVQLASVNGVSGEVNYITSLQPSADDVHLKDMVVDSSTVYLAGSTQYKFNNYDLGMVARVDKRSGKIMRVMQLGNTSFTSWTSVEKIKIMPRAIELVMKRDYRWWFLFNKTEWSAAAIEKKLD